MITAAIRKIVRCEDMPYIGLSHSLALSQSLGQARLGTTTPLYFDGHRDASVSRHVALGVPGSGRDGRPLCSSPLGSGVFDASQRLREAGRQALLAGVP